MSDPNTFPAWIAEAVSNNQQQLNDESREFFEKLLEHFPHFDRTFLSIPDTLDIGILKSYNPKEIQKQFGFESPHEFILLNICESFHFQATYQIRELGLSLQNSMLEGRFYVAAITIRAMLEVVCVNYYTFRRVEKQFKQCLESLIIARKTKSTAEKSRLLKIYYQGTYEIFTKLFDANTASSIDWSKYLREKFQINIAASEQSKKVHVNTAIEDIEKQSGLPLKEAYNLLSEFVHPNAGSKMLVVNTKQSHHPLMDALKIGNNKGNPEAALFFIDQLSESVFYTWTLALTLFNRGQELLEVIDCLIPKEPSKNVR